MSKIALSVVLVGSFQISSAYAADERVPAAFVKADPATRLVPTRAFEVKRAGKTVAYDGALQACDQVKFLPGQSGVEAILIGTVRSGKDIKLDKESLETTISCEKPGISALAAATWAAISGGKRAVQPAPISPKSRAVATREADFAIPLLTSERSYLVEGRRTLQFAWVGGKAPYTVIFEGKNSAQAPIKITGILRTSVQLPELSLKPGEYRLTIHHSPSEGHPGATDDGIMVVPADQLPAKPKALINAKLPPNEETLLYAMYLEGIADGTWTLEAFQMIGTTHASDASALGWLRAFGLSSK